MVVVALLGTKPSTAALVDLAQGRVIRCGDLGLEPARAACSPVGQRLVVVTATGEVGLQEVDSGRWIRRPVGAHAGGITPVWAPDGSAFATLGNDGRIGLWDGRTGDRLGMVSVGDANSWTIANFQPDAHTLLIGTSDDGVFTWDTRLETWVERACDIAGRNLTAEEWSDAFGDRPYRETCPGAPS